MKPFSCQHDYLYLGSATVHFCGLQGGAIVRKTGKKERKKNLEGWTKLELCHQTTAPVKRKPWNYQTSLYWFTSICKGKERPSACCGRVRWGSFWLRFLVLHQTIHDHISPEAYQVSHPDLNLGTSTYFILGWTRTRLLPVLANGQSGSTNRMPRSYLSNVVPRRR